MATEEALLDSLLKGVLVAQKHLDNSMSEAGRVVLAVLQIWTCGERLPACLVHCIHHHAWLLCVSFGGASVGPLRIVRRSWVVLDIGHEGFVGVEPGALQNTKTHIMRISLK